MPRGQTVLATWPQSKAGLYPQGSEDPVEEVKLGVMELEGENQRGIGLKTPGGESSSPCWPRKWLWGWEKPALELFLDSSTAYHPPQCPKSTPHCHPPGPTRAFVKEQPPQNLGLSVSRPARHIQLQLLILDTKSQH